MHLNKNLILKNSKISRKGVFAKKEFGAREEIIDFKGKLINKKELPEINSPEDDRFMQVGRGLYMGPSNDFDDYFNHSCDPNSGLIFKKNKVILIATKKIEKGEEILWDYSTVMEGERWEMACLCGSKKCRKRIRNFNSLPKKLRINISN